MGWEEVRETLLALRDCEGLADDAYAAALRVISFIELCYLPTPLLMTHGADSIVFYWETPERTVYVTISAAHVSWLCSSPEKILSRLDAALMR